MPAWSCNGTRALPRVYTGGPDVRFVGPNPSGVFGRRYDVGDLNADGQADLVIGEILPLEDFDSPCRYEPGDGGAYWIADPLAGGALEEVAVRFPADIVGCPETTAETSFYGSWVQITEHDYTGDGLRDLLVLGPEGTRVFSGTPTMTREKADADLFLPDVGVGGPELDLDLDGDLEFAGSTVAHFDGPVPTLDSTLADLGFSSYFYGTFVDFDGDGVPEVFGKTGAASLVHVEAPITRERLLAAESGPFAHPPYLEGNVRGLRGGGGDWWHFVRSDAIDPDFADDPCYDQRSPYLARGTDFSEARFEEGVTTMHRYQQGRQVPDVHRVGDFDGDGIDDVLLDDLHDLLVLLGPIEPGPLRVDDAIRIPAGTGFSFAPYAADAVYDIDGDGRDDVIVHRHDGSLGVQPSELHIYLASSFLNGPFDQPTEPNAW